MLNKEVKAVVEYCEELGLGILSINVYRGEFMVERDDGTPTMCSFDDIPSLTGI